MSLASLDDDRETAALTAALLTAVMAAALLLPQTGAVGRFARAAEAVAWAVVVTATGTVGSPHLTYILAPALAGGMVEGARAAVLVPGAAAGALLAAHLVSQDMVSLQEFSSTAAQWVVLATVAGAMGAATRLLQRPAPSSDEQVQLAAHRLLVQLRTLSRRLPGSLDPATTAEALLHELRGRLPVDEAWVLVRGAGDERLRPIASTGADELTWDTSLSSGSPLAEAWATQQATVAGNGHSLAAGGHTGGSALALPLSIGPSVFGVVAILTRLPNAFSDEQVAKATAAVRSVALALDTGLLFDEIRASATAEERARLSREIHDGVAQDIASLGYVVDGLRAEAGGGPLESGLSALRGELTRVVTELRLSLYDLRSSVVLHAGLGAALGEHVRQVGAGSGLTVHLSLSEGTSRLPPTTEAELLRIAQEAIANARKHSGADNLWVRCDIAPPNVLLVVEDDGRGRQNDRRATGRGSGHGLAIMAERAARAGAALAIESRPGGSGTRVTVSIGNVVDAQMVQFVAGP